MKQADGIPGWRRALATVAQPIAIVGLLLWNTYFVTRDRIRNALRRDDHDASALRNPARPSAPTPEATTPPVRWTAASLQHTLAGASRQPVTGVRRGGFELD